MDGQLQSVRWTGCGELKPSCARMFILRLFKALPAVMSREEVLECNFQPQQAPFAGKMEGLKAVVADKEHCLDALLTQASHTLSDHSRLLNNVDDLAASVARYEGDLCQTSEIVAKGEEARRAAAKNVDARVHGMRKQMADVEAALQVLACVLARILASPASN